MKLSRRQFLWYSGIFTGATLASPRRALAAPTVISTLPTIITNPGEYILSGNINTNLPDGAAISIQADNVTLDLGGFTVSNLSAGLSSKALGIFVDDRVGITIKNGTLERFYTGILLRSTTGRSARHFIEAVSCLDYMGCGFLLAGNGIVLKSNAIETTRRSTVFGVPSCTSGVMAIGLMQTERCVLLDTSIKLYDEGDGDVTFGIYTSGSCKDVIALGTHIENGDIGIVVDQPEGGRGEVRDSIMTNVTRELVGVINLGNNG